MDQLAAMRAFVRVVETGTFTRAADLLDTPKPTVTKLIQQLETHLRAKLLNRTTRRVTVTMDGAAYYERALKLVRPGGLIVLDNMLLSGKVADPSDMDVSAAALRALNEKILKDERVEMALTTIGDGMTLCIRK